MQLLKEMESRPLSPDIMDELPQSDNQDLEASPFGTANMEQIGQQTCEIATQTDLPKVTKSSVFQKRIISGTLLY